MSAPLASLDISTLRSHYRAGTHEPVDVIEAVLRRVAERGDDKVWIHRVPADEVIRMAKALATHKPGDSIVLDVVDQSGPRRVTMKVVRQPATLPGG